MHQCLLIDELVNKIVDECTWTHKVLTGTDTEGLATLNALARTCRALFDPALDVMWYRQDTLAHVIKCLPDEMWEMTASKASLGRGELRLTETGTASLGTNSDTWTRFDIYAKRIRVYVALRPDGSGPPHRSRTMLDLLRATRGAPLLPNLRSITLQAFFTTPCDTVHFAACVATPALREISLSLRDAATARKSPDALPNLAASCPGIQRATFTMDPALVDFGMLEKTVMQWNDLRSLVLRVAPCTTFDSFEPITVLDYNLLCSLSKLSKLEELELEMWTGANDAWFSGGDAFIGPDAKESFPFAFRTLRRVRIQTRDTSTVRAVLEAVSSPVLHELDVSVSDLSAFTILPSLLQNRQGAEQLRSLSIASCPRTLGQEGTVVRASSLRPLEGLCELRELSLSVGGGSDEYTFGIGDEDWEVWAPSWPSLRRLAIVDSRASGSSTNIGMRRPTVQTLTLLARHCAELESVAMTLRDCETVALDENLPVNTHFKRLHLRYTSLSPSSLSSLAQILGNMFPALRAGAVTRIVDVPRVIMGFRDSRPEEVPWEELEELLERHR